MLDWARSHKGRAFLLFIFALIFITNFAWGKLIIGNDNFSPELNTSQALERVLSSPAWRDYRVLGIASDSEQSDLGRILIYRVFDLVLPGWLISQAYIFLALFLGSWFTGKGAEYVSKKYFKIKSTEFIFLVSGLVYLLNFKMLHVFYFILVLFVAAYGFSPMFIYYSLRLLEKLDRDTLVKFALSVVLLSTAAFTITTFIVFVPVWLTILGLAFWIDRKKKHTRFNLLAILGLFTLLVSFWATPFVYFTFANAEDVQASFINRQITPNTIELEADVNNVQDSVIYRFSWINIQYDGEHAFIHKDFYDNAAIRIFSFAPVFLSLIGSLYIIKKKKWAFLVLPGLVIAATFITVGTNPPFGWFYRFLQDYIPFFRQVFRWQSSKVWLVSLWPMSILAGLGAFYLKQVFIGKRGGREKSRLMSLERGISYFGLSIATVLPILIFAIPVLRGGLVFPRLKTQVPQEYKHLQSYLEDEKPSDRIYLAPEANTLYFRNHDWSEALGQESFSAIQGPGFFGSGFLHYLLPNPLIERNLIVGSQPSEDAQFLITSAYNSGDQLLFTKSLDKYDANLVLVDKSNTDNDPGYDYDWNLLEKQTKDNVFLKEVWSEGFLSLYEVDYSTGRQETLLDGHNAYAANAFSITEGTYSDQITSSESGDIYPLALEPDNISREGSDIVMRSVFKGSAGTYSFSDKITLAKGLVSKPRPTRLSAIDGALYLAPGEPEISILNKLQESFARADLATSNLPSNTAFVSVGDQYAAIDELNEGSVTFDYPVDDADKNTKVFSNNSTTTDLRKLLDGAVLVNDDFTPLDDAVDVDDSGNITLASTGIRKSLIKDIPVSAGSINFFVLDIESDEPVVVSFCAQSVRKGRCLNKYTTTVVDGKKEISVPLSSLAGSQDSIVYNLNWVTASGEDTEIILSKADLVSYTDSTSLSFAFIKQIQSTPREIDLAPGDTIEVRIPIIRSKSTYDFLDSGDLLPEYDPRACGDISKENSSLSIENSGCLATFYPLLHLDNDSKLNMIFLDAENEQGVPLDVSLKQVGDDVGEQYFYQQRAAYLDDNARIDYFFTPTVSQDYRFELSAWGGEKNESINRLNSLIYMNIPEVWSEFKLTPNDTFSTNQVPATERLGLNLYTTNANAGDTVTIPQSSAPGWVILKTNLLPANTEKVTINNWRQGFRVDQDGSYIVFFWPNIVSQLLILEVLVVAGYLSVGLVTDLCKSGIRFRKLHKFGIISHD